MSQQKEKSKEIIGKEKNKMDLKEPSKKEIYIELRALDENIKELHAQIEKTEEQITELKTNAAILQKFTELKPGIELRVPLASGIYIKSQLKDTEKVMINVGADVMVEKKPEEVIKILENQVNEISEYRKNLIQKIKSMIQRAEELQKKYSSNETEEK